MIHLNIGLYWQYDNIFFEYFFVINTKLQSSLSGLKIVLIQIILRHSLVNLAGADPDGFRQSLNGYQFLGSIFRFPGKIMY